jgi:predicted nucleic acid-binding protein
MNAIDTNLWIYCYDTRDPAKQQKARSLTSSIEPLVLLWQVGCEFIAAARKLEPFGFTQHHAWAALAKIEALADWVLLPEREVWTLACDLQQRHSHQFWDALLVAACVRGGVRTLCSIRRISSMAPRSPA